MIRWSDIKFLKVYPLFNLLNGGLLIYKEQIYQLIDERSQVHQLENLDLLFANFYGQNFK